MNLAVFDIDGTLIQCHRKGNDRAYIRALLEVFGIDQEDTWTGFVNSTDSGILDEMMKGRLGRKLLAEEIIRFKESMAKWLEKEYGSEPFEPTSGALRIWDELLNHPRWKMAVATGNWEFAGRFKLERSGFNLDAVPLASADDGESRERILEIAKRLSFRKYGFREFEKIVYVGDRLWDVKAAKALEWDFIGIHSGESVKALREAGVKRILPDFNGLISEIDKI